MSKKGLDVLESHIKAFGAQTIAYVVSAEDKMIENDFFTEIKKVCRINKIKFFHKKNKNNLQADIVFAISWRWIIDVDHKLIVFHDSILPKYRGFAPLVNSLINGEKKIGVTAIWASKNYDAGDIVGQKKMNIRYPLKIEQAIDSISKLYCELQNEISKKILYGTKLKQKKQNEKLASYSLWRDDEDYRIDWTQSAKKIVRFIHAVGFPYNGAKTEMDGKIFKILDSQELADVKIVNRTVGKIIFMQENYPVIVCGRGLLKVTKMTTVDGTSSLPLKKFRSRFK